MSRALVLLLALLLTPLAAAAEATADPPYRATGQWILYLTMASIVAGIIGTWWVVKRYEP